MPLFAMLSSCNMLFDSSKHGNLMLFLQSLKLILFAILPCVFEHVLVISGVAQCSCFVMLYLYIMPMPFVIMLRCCNILF